MKHVFGLFLVGLLVVPAANAALVTVDPGAGWIGYMNVFNKPQDGGGYQFGSSWGTADLCATWAGSTLTLSPNTIGDANEYWYTPAGGPGAVGNKTMDANLYVETPLGSYAGETLTFAGSVLSNTLFGQVNQIGNGWTSVAFIKDFAGDYSSFNQVTAPMVNGAFSISYNVSADTSRHIQYGFETVGPDVWITDVGQYGNIQIVPEPATLGMLLIGGLALLRRR